MQVQKNLQQGGVSQIQMHLLREREKEREREREREKCIGERVGRPKEDHPITRKWHQNKTQSTSDLPSKAPPLKIFVFDFFNLYFLLSSVKLSLMIQWKYKKYFYINMKEEYTVVKRPFHNFSGIIKIPSLWFEPS